MSRQLKIWKSHFGEEWTDRNKVDPLARVRGFKKLVDNLDGIKSILEVGCGAGHNLVSLKKVNPSYILYGIEPLSYAIKNSEVSNLYTGDCFSIPFLRATFDLVFTCGVLMHVSPEDIPRAVVEINRVTIKYILIIEYGSEVETTIDYHGHKDLLWKRDYSKLFSNLEASGSLTEEEGFDRCDWWLFKK